MFGQSGLPKKTRRGLMKALELFAAFIIASFLFFMVSTVLELSSLNTTTPPLIQEMAGIHG